jgi:hypothetical protein
MALDKVIGGGQQAGLAVAAGGLGSVHGSAPLFSLGVGNSRTAGNKKRAFQMNARLLCSGPERLLPAGWGEPVWELPRRWLRRARGQGETLSRAATVRRSLVPESVTQGEGRSLCACTFGALGSGSLSPHCLRPLIRLWTHYTRIGGEGKRGCAIWKTTDDRRPTADGKPAIPEVMRFRDGGKPAISLQLNAALRAGRDGC